MKKIIFGVVLLIICIMDVKADTTLYRYQYDDETGIKTVRFKDIDKEFDLYLDDEVEISDYRDIHNMAYYGYYKESVFEKIIAQIMIWEVVYPNYRFKVIDNDDMIINLQYFYNDLSNFLNYYREPCNLDGKVSDVPFGGSVIYQGKYKMEAYTGDKFRISSSNKFIYINDINDVGTHIIHFRVVENIHDNKIVATAPNMGDFTTTINYLGNKIVFNIDNDNEFVFDLIDADTGILLGTYSVNKNHNYIDYDYNHNVILVDKTSNSLFKRFEDIIINENDSHRYNIELKPDYYQNKVSFIAPLMDENYNIINIDIYDSNNIVEKIRCNKTCDISLNKGSYHLINNNTLEEYNIVLENDLEYDLSNNYLKGLILNYNIDKIINNNEEIDFNQDNELITFDNYLTGLIYLEIQGKLYEIELDHNYEYINDFGLVKRLNIVIDEEIVEEPVTENNEIDNIVINVINDNIEVIKTDEVVIDIPNTDDNIDIKWGNLIDKKKYFYTTFNYMSITY